jgi:hypothetical protein
MAFVTRPRVTMNEEERDALADAVEALRWIAEFAADERAMFQAKTALARLDGLA